MAQEELEVEFYNDAEKSWDHTYKMLSGAVKDRTSPFRTGNIAYVSEDRPQIRTVVLRHVAQDLREVGFHTDYRAPKVQAFLQNPNMTMHFYAPSEKLQFIADGTASIHYKDEIAQKAWEKTQLLSRRCYLSEAAPSDLSEYPTSGFPELLTANSHTLEESEAGYENFCVIRLHIISWERLYLHRKGNRRIGFHWDQKKELFTPQWLNP